MSTHSHSVFEFAVERDWLEDNPCRRVKSLKVKNAQDRWLSTEELDRLYEECKNSNNPHTLPGSQDLHPDRVQTGGTVSQEVLQEGQRGQTPQRPQKVFDSYVGGLKWENVDLDKGLLLLTHTKTGLNRKVAVTGDALELLRDLSKTPCIHGYVFHINGVPRGRTDSIEGVL